MERDTKCPFCKTELEPKKSTKCPNCKRRVLTGIEK